eukprot:scaffold660_cov365-Pavlova_lutheri.AAC.17
MDVNIDQYFVRDKDTRSQRENLAPFERPQHGKVEKMLVLPCKSYPTPRPQRRTSRPFSFMCGGGSYVRMPLIDVHKDKWTFPSFRLYVR